MGGLGGPDNGGLFLSVGPAFTAWVKGAGKGAGIGCGFFPLKKRWSGRGRGGGGGGEKDSSVRTSFGAVRTSFGGVSVLSLLKFFFISMSRPGPEDCEFFA